MWADALRMALHEDDPQTGQKKLRLVAKKLVDLALDGDVAAIKEIGDRTDGKPKQSTEISGEDGPLLTRVLIEHVSASSDPE